MESKSCETCNHQYLVRFCNECSPAHCLHQPKPEAKTETLEELELKLGSLIRIHEAAIRDIENEITKLDTEGIYLRQENARNEIISEILQAIHDAGYKSPEQLKKYRTRQGNHVD